MRRSMGVLISTVLVTLAAPIPACRQATGTPTPSGPTATVPYAQELQTVRAEILNTMAPQHTADAMTENAQRTIQAMTPSNTPGPTRTPTPTVPSPTPYPTIARTPPAMPPVETVYGQGAVPAGALARIGIGRVAEIKLSPDGSILAVGTAAGIYAFDSLTGAQMWEDATYAPVVEIEWSPDGAWIAARMSDWGNVLIWDGDTGDFVRRLETGGVVHSIAWSPDRSQIAAGYTLNPREAEVQRLLIWDSRTGEALHDILLAASGESLVEGDDPERPYGVDWSPDGERLAVVVGSRSIALINASTGRIVNLMSQDGATHSYVQFTEFSPDSRLLVTYNGLAFGDAGGGDNRAYVWDVATGRRVFTLEHDYYVGDVSWSPDGSRLATATLNRDTLAMEGGQGRVWDMTTGDNLISSEGGLLDLSTLAWSSMGERFITSDPTSGEILIWDPSTGQATPFGYQFGDMQTYSPTAYVGRDTTGDPLIWNSAAGTPSWILRTLYGLDNAAWSPDEQVLAMVPLTVQYWWLEGRTNTDTTVTLWNAEGQFVQSYPALGSAPEWVQANVLNPQFSPDCSPYSETNYDFPSVDRSVSVVETEVEFDVYETLVTVRSLQTGNILRELVERGATTVCNVAFSPDGQLLAIGHEGGYYFPNISTSYVTVWNIENGELLRQLDGHTMRVPSLYWSPDGNLLATGSFDWTILIWQIR